MSVEAHVTITCDECSSTIETFEPVELATGYLKAWGFDNDQLVETHLWEADGSHLCQDCWDHTQHACDECGESHEYHEMTDHDGSMYCKTCWEDRCLRAQQPDPVNHHLAAILRDEEGER